jgi:hypothetical protein
VIEHLFGVVEATPVTEKWPSFAVDVADTRAGIRVDTSVRGTSFTAAASDDERCEQEHTADTSRTHHQQLRCPVLAKA